MTGKLALQIAAIIIFVVASAVGLNHFLKNRALAAQIRQVVQQDDVTMKLCPLSTLELPIECEARIVGQARDEFRFALSSAVATNGPSHATTRKRYVLELDGSSNHGFYLAFIFDKQSNDLFLTTLRWDGNDKHARRGALLVRVDGGGEWISRWIHTNPN